ncbi:hypothetical protein K1T73_16255 [Roseovarius sp. SCSIO 43702]|uniref:hypothetical protein n=1 Tax=Roseovarius sp. SCSIO 43702 TaxID=2823043 RepID=UPI001C72A761|nr:hypothetical protein [Roseovarius sp. SCSIO 43702]QYX56574.1 hypothetical protein K1T73_16255 [Roseovarius sp. SCSIO 43702]
MQVIIHAGAHMTDDEKLLKCLMGNEPVLSELGTHVPHPSTYRKQLRDLLNDAGATGLPPADARAQMMRHMGLEDGPEPERIVLSNHGFFGTPRMAVSTGQFYPAAGKRMEIFQRIFEGDDLELFFALRNPASFLPAMTQETRYRTVSEYLGGGDPHDMRWSEMLERVHGDCPQVPITVWCNEDTPLIWSEILREMAGVEPTIRLDGEYLLLREIMTAPGMKRFLSYMDSHPDMTEIQKRRVIVAFLDKFADEEAIEEELDLPGWTEAMVEELSEAYDEDLYAVTRIPGTTLLAP